MTRLANLRTAAAALSKHLSLPAVALLLIAAIIIATATYSYREIDNKLTAVALSRREVVAQLIAAILTEKFGRSIDVAVSLASRVRFTNLVAEGKWEESLEIMRDVPNQFPYIERLFLTDIHATLKADIPHLPGVRGVNFAYRDWFKGVSRNWQPYVSPIYTRVAVPQINIFSVAVPVKNSAGQVIGILGLQLRIEKLLETTAKIDLGAQAVFYIVDSNGRLAIHSKHWDRNEFIDLSKNPMVQKLLQGERGVEVGYDAAAQEDSIIAYATVPGYGWGVVVEQPTRMSGLAARDSQLRQLMAGYGLILLLCSVIIILTLQIARARNKTEDDRRMHSELERLVTERTSELQVANRELESFSYAVSHDLRAPLRSIDGFSKAVMEDYADRLDEKGKDFIDRVRTATQRMGQLIDDMLALSCVTLAEMQRAGVDLSELAAGVFAELQKSEPHRKVNWRIEPGMRATGDQHLLRLLLVNLLGNAWKFTGKSSNATIEFGIIRNTDEPPQFFVRDNGAGFDMAYADKLFGAFRRLHTTAEFPGTGIGLATVQRIINRHGGKVRGEGLLGHGATFYFTLPN